ncbi:MAG: glycoside hydrolase family 28 protein [Melioribacteraceae bacterium]|nr:glycoside hydrolase family 28 protein [Melioribacteraceae bacterium]
MPELIIPVFPEKEYSIIDFGAVGDGLYDNTDAINSAIKACAEEGGGKVVIPSGIWKTGPVYLRSNVNLHLLIGAHVQFSQNFDDYPIIDATYEGTRQYRCTSPINGVDLENIAITGEGIIDGGGEAWRPVKKFKMTGNQWKELVNNGGVVTKDGKMWYPSEAAMNGAEIIDNLLKEKKNLTIEDVKPVRDFLRPVMVSLVRCKNILLDGVTFQNSPAWNIHPLMCENLIARNLFVRNPWYSQNGDGIDIESCKNSIVYKCKFDVGDDAICMKSGKNEYGRERGIPTENLIIADCIVYHGHGGFTIGSEMSGGVRNIKVSNCNFIGTDVGLRFKSTRGRGGIVENIYIDNIYMKDIPTRAVSFNMFYGGMAPTEAAAASEESAKAEKVPVTVETPVFRDIYLNKIYCDGADEAIVLQGLPELPIKNIVIENTVMKAKKGLAIYDGEFIDIKNTTLFAEKNPAVKIIQGNNIIFDGLVFHEESSLKIILAGYKTGNIEFRNNQTKLLEEHIEVKEGVGKNPFTIIMK